MSPASASAFAAERPPCPLDPSVWRAITGVSSSSSRIPSPGSRVYYFPSGHAEQASSPPPVPSSSSSSFPFAICTVSSVSFLADPDTDEAFASISLSPPPTPSPPPPPSPSPSDAVSFAKILTPSDANNGGGFSVPRFCADSIFPPLDFAADPPVQNLTIHDVHNNAWAFRHIYRGTPRRHLLTTGWSKFVNTKKLVAGDSVVFVRDRSGVLFVGVRRSYGRAGGAEVKLEEGFSRAGRGRVPAAAVGDAMRMLEVGRPFEVVYYPRAGSQEFVVAEETVEAAMRVDWSAGMRVRMAVDTENSSRTTWFKGTVSAVVLDAAAGQWPRPPWRMLQGKQCLTQLHHVQGLFKISFLGSGAVLNNYTNRKLISWDDPDIMKNARSVSPWQVELVSDSDHLLAAYPAIKKPRVSERPESPSIKDGNVFFQMTGFNATKVESVTPSLFSYSTSPAGMQGARQDTYVSSLSQSVSPTSHGILSEDLYGFNLPSDIKNVSSELSIGDITQSHGSSLPSQESTNVNGTELLSAAASTPTGKIKEVCFQLFGQVIRVKQPPHDDFDKEYNESKDEVGSLGYSPLYPQKQLLNNLDVQCQKISAKELRILLKQ